MYMWQRLYVYQARWRLWAAVMLSIFTLGICFKYHEDCASHVVGSRVSTILRPGKKVHFAAFKTVHPPDQCLKREPLIRYVYASICTRCALERGKHSAEI